VAIRGVEDARTGGARPNLDRATVQRNVSRDNGVTGIVVSGESTYRENTVSLNGATVSTLGGGIDLGHNSCNGTTTCP
jgi:hypothetical protein